MAKHVIIGHAVNWMDIDPASKRPVAGTHNTGKRGEEHEIPDQEVERLHAITKKYGVATIGTREDYEAWMNTPGLPESPTVALSDAQLNQLTGEQLLAHLDQTNADAERVLALEEARARPRKAVVSAARDMIDARDQAAVERQMQAERTARSTESDSNIYGDPVSRAVVQQ